MRRRDLLVASGGAACAVMLAGAGQPGVPKMTEAGVKHGGITVRGRTVDYRADTGERPLRLADGEVGGTIFSVSYVEEKADPSKRPVTFVWNGGPGSTTYLLRQQLAPRMFTRAATPRGFDYTDNFNSPIDVTDLVFIDAPGIGYSRLFTDRAKAEWWGIEQDGHVFTEFIAQWLDRMGRRSSPVFLLGESYGGTRAAQVIRQLAEWRGGAIDVTGAVLVSPSLGETGQGLPTRLRAGAPYVLPTYAAAAWWNRRGAHVGETLDEVVDAAQRFADGPFRAAIDRGDALPAQDRKTIAQQVSDFIGLPVETVLAENLAVPIGRYRDELLGSRNRRLDMYDARISAPKPQPGEKQSSLDVAEGFDLHAAITGIINEDLGFRTSAPYLREPEEINGTWNDKLTRQPSALIDITRARLAKGSRLHILLVAGYYDFAIPYWYPFTALREAGLPADRLHQKVYGCGHGVYEDDALRPKTTDDLRAFYRTTLGY